MDQQQPASVGTPNVAQMHMQQQRPDVLGSPAVGSQPVTPQHIMQAQTPGQFQQQQAQQQHEFQFQQGTVPPSPSTPVVGQTHPQGTAMGTDGSPGLYNRQMHPQMIQQQQMMQQQGGQMAGMPPGYQGYPTSQQQQWAQHQQMQAQQAAHYARNPQMMGSQPGQQVMIRRVPYPQGTGYPQAMQAAQAGQQGPPAGFPGRPGAPPGAQAMQRPQYPQGTAQPPPQYPQYPPAPGQQAYPGQGYPAQQMYPRAQVPPQVGQPMRPYISPQGGMVTPQVYGNNPTQATPQTPQTPQQAPFTPNGTRFPQPTPSPHYAAAAAAAAAAVAGTGGPQDIRSPSLMSPNQPPQPMQAPQMQRPMSNGDMVNQPMRMPVGPPQQAHPNHMQPFFAHEPAILANINADNCLLGCVIHVYDLERVATDKTDIVNLQIAVKMRGGDLDSHPKSYQEKQQSITHVVVDCFRSPHAAQALKDRKRLVTLQWLTEVLLAGKMDVPSKLAHLPSFCTKGTTAPGVEQALPCLGKFFSLSGFDEMERAACKWMIEAIGGRMTPNFSRNNHFLIAKQPIGEKFEKAREWELPAYNYTWLVDLYISGRLVEAGGDMGRYVVGAPGHEVASTPYNLEMIHEMAKNMLYAWKVPITVHPDQWQKAQEVRRNLLNDENIYVNRRFKYNLHETPTLEQIAVADRQRKEKDIEQHVTVAFSGCDDDVKDGLSKRVLFLGGRVTENVSECTHLVTVQGGRSERLLEAIALGKNIVNPLWINYSFECKYFMDTFDYFLRDEDSEKHLGYNCKRSVLRARNRPVFEDVTFYISPNVEPSLHSLTRLIRLAGGKVDDQRPDPAMLASCIERDSLYIVISSEADIRSLTYLLDCNFPVYTTEFALMALLRQEIQPHGVYRLQHPPRQIQRPPIRQQAPPPVHPQAEPPRIVGVR